MNLMCFYTTDMLWLRTDYISYQEEVYIEWCVFYTDVILKATSEITQNLFYFQAKDLSLFQLRDEKW